MDEILKKIKQREKIDYNLLESTFNSYLSGKLDDEKMTEILKCICMYGLATENVFDLTDIFVKSGTVLKENYNYIDKHSTGGVGDKTTLIVLPILASLGVKVSKMSGGALGYTGGTIDKLNSIGVKTDLTNDEIEKALEECNMVISSQTKDLCPMDKKVYALRHRTNTTNSIELIAVSIMSKKIACGAGKILIDIKVGNGSLVGSLENARYLADLMIKIGKKYDRKVICMLTRMDEPLGNNIGNKIEVLEVIKVLKNEERGFLRELALKMATIMYQMEKGVSKREAYHEVLSALNTEKAYKAFLKYVEYQGGSLKINLASPKYLVSKKSGYIKEINAKEVGLICNSLKENNNKYDAGIILKVKKGDYVQKEKLLGEFYGNKEADIDKFYDCIKYSHFKRKNKDIIIDIIY
ncbi:MAG: thymidine phosphorylase [bacterium]|nr:thymidine phosphorylase [bacterium]